MPKIINPKDFDHWLQLKTEDVSSTESAALFGLSPYSTEFELYHQKLTGEVFTIDDNDRMYCGRMLEDTIAKMVQDQLGIKARRLKTYFRHDEEPHMSSSFDYEIVGDNSESQLFINNPHLKGSGLLEIKNVDSLVYRDEWTDDEAPPHIEVQVQHQMEVANRNWTLIVALVGGNRMKIILRDRDHAMGAAIRKRINKFWTDVASHSEPKPDFERDMNFILSMFNDDKGEAVDMTDDESLRSMVISYKELNTRKLALEKALDALKAEVIYTVGNASGLVSADGLTVNLKMTKGTLPTTVTEEMVGTEIGGRKGWRQFRITQKKVK
jgi:putative phage-type endonuclease